MKDHEHDGPKSSRGNHADIKRPTALRALSTVEANEKWRPYSLLPLDLSTRAIFHFVTIRKPLWLSRSSLIYEPTTIPFVIRVPYLSTLFISLLLYFSISFRPRIAGYPRATETPRSCLEESALLLHTVYRTLLDIFDRVTTVPAPSYKSPGLAPRTSLPARVNFGPRSTPIVSINEIYVANARKGTQRKGKGPLFVEREFRKCTRLSTVSTVKSEEIAQWYIIGRKDGRKEGEIYPAARELIFTRIIMDEEGGGMETVHRWKILARSRRGIWIPAMLQVCTDDFLMGASKVDPGLKS